MLSLVFASLWGSTSFHHGWRTGGSGVPRNFVRGRGGLDTVSKIPAAPPLSEGFLFPSPLLSLFPPSLPQLLKQPCQNLFLEKYL